MNDQDRSFVFDSGSRMYVSGEKRKMKSQLGSVSGFKTEVLQALDELDDHLVMYNIHEEGIAEYLKNNEELTDRPGILVAAGSVLLHEMKQVEFGEFRAYHMGDTVVVEESDEDDWQHVASVPHDVAVLVAQARAESRSRALKMDHPKLREAVNQEIQDRMDDGGNSGDKGPFGAAPVQVATPNVATAASAAASTPTAVASDLNVSIEGSIENITQNVLNEIDQEIEKELSIGFNRKE